jgi:hypothetical protein
VWRVALIEQIGEPVAGALFAGAQMLGEGVQVGRGQRPVFVQFLEPDQIALLRRDALAG